jgi:hypothetical protein
VNYKIEQYCRCHLRTYLMVDLSLVITDICPCTEFVNYVRSAFITQATGRGRCRKYIFRHFQVISDLKKVRIMVSISQIRLLESNSIIGIKFDYWNQIRLLESNCSRPAQSDPIRRRPLYYLYKRVK